MAKKLGRTTDGRLALLRNLATDVIMYGRVETSETKAKELKRIVDKMVTFGKRGDLHARRQAAKFLYKKRMLDGEIIDANRELKEEEKEGNVETTIDKLFGEIANRYENVQGGYTRVLKLGPRRGDGANMVIVELRPLNEDETAGESVAE